MIVTDDERLEILSMIHSHLILEDRVATVNLIRTLFRLRIMVLLKN
jgi:hypothetical protein